MNIEIATGITAGILTSVSLLPQLIKVIKEKEAKDISAVMLIVLLSGLALWVVYGIMKTDLPIIITNSFSAFLNLLLLLFKFKYRMHKN